MEAFIMLIEKPLLTLTNFAFIPAFLKFICSSSYLQAMTLSFAAIASMIYHSTEPMRNLPHFSNPLGGPPLLKLDQFGAVIAMIALANGQMIKDYYFEIIILFVLMITSDLVYLLPYSRQIKIVLRLLLHCPWHVGALGYLPYIRATNPEYQSNLFMNLFRLFFI